MLTRRNALRAARRFARLSGATVGLIVLALLLGGAQHALRLCRVGDHAGRPTGAASQPSCHEHGGEPAPAQAPPGDAVPPCCAPSAVLVALPSVKDFAGAVRAAERPSPWSGVLVGTARDGASPHQVRALDAARARNPHLHRRRYLALRTIIV